MAEQKINQRMMGEVYRISCTAAYGKNIKTERKANFILKQMFALTEQPCYMVCILYIDMCNFEHVHVTVTDVLHQQ